MQFFPSTEAVAEFTRIHGGPPVNVQGGQLLKDGSLIAGDTLREPPAEARHRLMAQRRYHAVLLDRLGQEAGKLDAALHASAFAYVEPWRYPRDGSWLIAHIGRPLPGDNGEEMLTRLRQLVERERRAVAELDAQIGPPIFA